MRRVSIVAGCLALAIVGFALVSSCSRVASTASTRDVDSGVQESAATTLVAESAHEESTEPAAPRFSADAPPPGSFRCLVLGNSHTSSGAPFPKLALLVEARPSGGEMGLKMHRGAFLESLVDVVRDPSTYRPQTPDVVVLQGQKYSMSGRFDYPIDTAIDLARKFRGRGCRVLLMPEWRMRGNIGEAQRVLEIYERIAEGAVSGDSSDRSIEVVPVGLVWDRVLDEHPEWELYLSDGNHANDLGGLLTALTFYCWLYDEVPADGAGIHDNEREATLAAIALEVCRDYRAAR